MTVPCFVDANVFLYTQDVRDPRKREIADTLLARLWGDQAGRTSIQVLNEYYSVLTRKFRHAVAHEVVWADIEALMAWNPLPVDAEVMHRARHLELRYRLNWWDAMIVAAAQLQDCRILYSEDLHHGAVFDFVQVRNPFIEQVNEPAPPEYVAPRKVSAHRPRGRPRTAV